MIRPYLKDDALLSDIRQAEKDTRHLHLWWLGQSGFLLQWQSHHLLLDPYLSDSLTRKYERTERPHVRMTERVVDPERLDFIDVVTSSHNHTDHLDAETLRPLIRRNPGLHVIVPEANRAFAAARLQTDAGTLIGLDAGGSIDLAGFKVSAVPAAHNELDRNERGQHKYLGYVVEAGPYAVYHSGDTLLFPGLENWVRRWSVDVALLPINGHRPERGVAGNLNGGQAAELAKRIGARVVIPCHYEMFEFNTASANELVQAARELEQPCRVLQAGERWSSVALEGSAE